MAEERVVEIRVYDDYQNYVYCEGCHGVCRHDHAHTALYSENAHVAGTERWICRNCGNSINKAQAEARRLNLTFFHD